MRDEIFYRDLEIEERGLDIENRKIDLSFSSEIAVQRWFGIEILSHKDGAVDMSRLQSMLFGHNKERIVGPVSKKRLENGNGRAAGGFDETDEGNLAMARVKSGSLRGVSAGYVYLDKKVRKLAEGEEYQLSTRTIKGTRDDNPTYIIERWAPIEISLTPIPADHSVGVGRDFTRSLEQELGIGIEEQPIERAQDNQKLMDEAQSMMGKMKSMMSGGTMPNDTKMKAMHAAIQAVHNDMSAKNNKKELSDQGGESEMDEKEIRENLKTEMKKVFDRAAAMGEKGQALAFRLMTEGKTPDEITDALFAEVQKQRGTPTDSGDGTQDNPKTRKFEEITDDEFARALLTPTIMNF